MRPARAVNPAPLPPRRPNIAALGNDLQQLAALGDHDWIEDLHVVVRKRLRTVRASVADSAGRDPRADDHEEP